MKIKTTRSILAAFAAFLFAVPVQACNYSYATMNSVTPLGGGHYQVNLTMCAGGGQTIFSGGSEYGADQATSIWAMRVHGADWVSWPATLTSPSTGSVYSSSLISSDRVRFINAAGDLWTCLTTACGPAGSYCITFDIVTLGEPAAVSFWGIEAQGNLNGGCSPIFHETPGWGSGDMIAYRDSALCSNTISLSGVVTDIGCPGTGAIDVTVSGGVTPYSYLWQGSAPVNGATTQDVSGITVPGSHYLIVVEEANGCPDFELFSVTSIPTVTANAGPDQNIYIGYGPSCVTLTGSGTGGTPPYSYAWSTGATTSSINVCPTSTLGYTVTVTDANGCSAADVAVVTVQNIVCGSNKVYMCNSAGQTKCVQTSQVPSKLAAGWTLGPCAAKMDISSLVITPELTISPNPVQDETAITIQLPSEGTAQVEIFDSKGAHAATIFNGMVSGKETTRFSTSDLNPGIYYVRLLTAGGETVSRKMIIMH